jgi:CRISPR/Cas system-associated exonuclease Cas4 (RecB family)
MDLLTEPLPPQTHIISVSPSRISTYLDCPKKYDYVYNQELAPVGPTKLHFNKGNYFHELAHVYYQLIKSGVEPGSDYALASIISRIQNDISKSDDMELIQVYGVITRAITRFIKEQSARIDNGIKVVAVEHELIFPLEGIILHGYADLVYYDNAGRLRVRDHKTGDKAWTKIDVQFSNQLLYYATLLYKTYNEVPIAEINYINTKESVKPVPYENAFTHTTVSYSQKELDIYFEEICMLIEEMLKSRPVPFYGQHCRYCAFQTPCYLSRKGIDPSNVIRTHFIKRDSPRKHASFTESLNGSSNTEDNTSNDGTN